MRAFEPGRHSLEAELRSLVDEYRTSCLWFLRPDLYPETREEMLRVLREIEKHADREGFVRAAKAAPPLRPDPSLPFGITGRDGGSPARLEATPERC
jgi:hypothetical protein